MSIALFLMACSGGDSSDCSDNPVAETGSITCNLVWQHPTDQTADARSVSQSPSGDVCADYGIETLHFSVGDSTGAEIKSGSWPCADHQGSIQDVSPGVSYTLTILNDSGVWQGIANDIRVTSGQTTAVDDVVMEYIGEDSTPPTIESHVPVEGETEVGLRPAIWVEFNEDVIPESISFSLIDTATSNSIACTFEYDSSVLTASFTPDAELSPNTNYLVTISAGVEDLANNKMAADFAWTFTTMANPVWELVTASLWWQYAFSLGIKTDGTLWAWGNNQYGQLGDGTTTDQLSPIQVGSDSNWAWVVAGQWYSVGIKTDGTLWAWGNNQSGKLGDGTTTEQHSPIQVGSDSDWASVAAGCHFTLGLKTDGALYAWGSNYFGQLGDGTTTDQHSPIRIASQTTWAWVAAGAQFSFGGTVSGQTFAWGANWDGQLGDGTTTNRHDPVPVGDPSEWDCIELGGWHAVGVKTDGTLWAWGNNEYGQLGIGSEEYQSLPSNLAENGANWMIVSAASTHSLGIKTDGTLWGWGANINGRLGDGTTTNHNLPVQVGSDQDWVFVIARGGYSMGIKADGTLWAWGNNEYGQLGDGTRQHRLEPVQIGGD